jgi:hypothetical protein
MQQNCSATNQYEPMRMLVKGEMHNILNNLPRSLILINFYFGRAVSKLLAIRPVAAEIRLRTYRKDADSPRAKTERAWLFPGAYCRERRGEEREWKQEKEKRRWAYNRF